MVLLLELFQLCEGVDDEVVLVVEFEGEFFFIWFLEAVALEFVVEFFDSVLESVGCDFESLPFGFCFCDAFSECELFYIFLFFDEFDGSLVHAFVELFRGEGVVVVE